MEFDKLTRKLARWALILQEYDFHVVHKPGVANLDADGLSQNPCTNQEDNTRVRWHGEVDEEMVPGWHALTFLCLLGVDFSMEGHVTSYSSQRVDGQLQILRLGMVTPVTMMFMMIHWCWSFYRPISCQAW
jgi:hypothetical protein